MTSVESNYDTIHFMHMQTKKSVCGSTAVGDLQLSIDIEKINCIECLRALVKDAARYGNGRAPRRGTS